MSQLNNMTTFFWVQQQLFIFIKYKWGEIKLHRCNIIQMLHRCNLIPPQYKLFKISKLTFYILQISLQCNKLYNTLKFVIYTHTKYLSFIDESDFDPILSVTCHILTWSRPCVRHHHLIEYQNWWWDQNCGY
jgi:hypothetical protein